MPPGGIFFLAITGIFLLFQIQITKLCARAIQSLQAFTGDTALRCVLTHGCTFLTKMGALDNGLLAVTQSLSAALVTWEKMRYLYRSASVAY
jgi:hypothetical protein